MAKKTERKVFVLDTNVILHDSDCIYKFKEHDVIIPTIVLEELDKFKKGNEEKNYNARKFIHTMDELREKLIKKNIGNENIEVSALCEGGTNLGKGLGNIEVRIARKVPQAIKETYPEDIADHRILGLIQEIQKDKRDTRKIILITKDVNLRVKASSLRITAEDYKSDKVESSDFYLGKETIENYPEKEIINLYTSQQDGIDTLKKIYKNPIQPNMFFVLKNEGKSVLVRFDGFKNQLVRVEKKDTSSITARNSEQTFALNALLTQEIKLVSLFGKAGTGKTLLAMAAGLEQLKNKIYDQIIIASANVPLSNKDIGALPGDANEKVSPYMQGIFDNLEFIKRQVGKKDQKWMEDMSNQQKEGNIKIQPLASIRGRSFNNTYFIIDETQNLTPHEVKTIVTRAGENTKVVFCGDITQIDSPYLDAYSNGLSHLISKMTGQNLFAHITLEKGERSELAELAATLL